MVHFPQQELHSVVEQLTMLSFSLHFVAKSWRKDEGAYTILRFGSGDIILMWSEGKNIASTLGFKTASLEEPNSHEHQKEGTFIDSHFEMP